MSVFRYDYFFTASELGWRETWYRVTTQTPDAALDDAQQLLVPRRDGLGKFALLRSFKITNLDVTRVTARRHFPQGGVFADAVGGINTYDCAWSGAQYRFYDAFATFRRTMVFRGMPDSWLQVSPRGREVETAPMNAWKNNFLKALTDGHFCFSGTIKVGVDAQKIVTAANMDEATRFLSLTVPGHGIVGEKQVVITRGVGTGMRYLNGRKWVLAMGADSLLLRPGPPEGVLFSYKPSTARLRPGTQVYPEVGSMRFRRYGHRDTGRPFSLQRGRARNAPR